MKILVTGGTGFIGSHLVEALIKKGYKVIIVAGFISQKRGIFARAKTYKADICSEKIDEIFRKERPDIVYHLAAYLPKSSIEKANFNLKNIRSNIVGTLRILEAAKKCGVKKIIFSSSAAVYGNSTVIPTPENYPVNPVSLYGLAKLTAEKLFEIYHKLFNLSYIVFRYGNVYGPGQNPEKQGSLIADFINKISQNKRVVINGNGRQTRDYVYVDDVVRANLLAIKANKVGIYNVGSGSEISVNKIFYEICRIFGKQIRPCHKPIAKTETKRNFLKINKIKKDLKWQPKISLNVGLKKTINGLKS